MNISAMNTAVRANATFGSAKTDAIEKEIKDLQEKPSDKVVDYGNWGGNYVYPITAGQKIESLQAELMRARAEEAYTDTVKDEKTSGEIPPEKLFSAEYFM